VQLASHAPQVPSMLQARCGEPAQPASHAPTAEVEPALVALSVAAST
jgi:hypothetical protein